MPLIVAQPQGRGVDPLLSEQEARLAVRVGQNKWAHDVRDQIDVTLIAGKRFYTAAAINRYLRKRTTKAHAKARSQADMKAERLTGAGGRAADNTIS